MQAIEVVNADVLVTLINPRQQLRSTDPLAPSSKVELRLFCELQRHDTIHVVFQHINYKTPQSRLIELEASLFESSPAWPQNKHLATTVIDDPNRGYLDHIQMPPLPLPPIHNIS